MDKLILSWHIANSGPDIGSTREELRDGWPAYIKKYVLPGIAWARESGIEPVLYVAHPFGQYATQPGDPMHLDAWDWAKAAKADWLINKFSTLTGWRGLSDVRKYAYVGGMHLTDRLRNLTGLEFGQVVERNLKPIADAGFNGVYIDWAENALAHPFKHPNVPSESLPTRSVDTVTLCAADKMFPERTGIEAAPRAFPDFRMLWDRNVVMQEEAWQLRYGPGRHKEWKALGFDRSVLKGSIWRTLKFKDDPTDTLAGARQVLADGCVPVLNPLPFIVNGIKAEEILR